VGQKPLLRQPPLDRYLQGIDDQAAFQVIRHIFAAALGDFPA
jgi:hypothetical protein